MELLVLTPADLRAALPMTDAIAVAKSAFAAHSAGEAVAPPRLALAVRPAGGTTLVMPAHLPGVALATKVVSVFPANAGRGQPVIQGLVLVLDETTGAPSALIDGAFATAWRTGAASGAATDALAARDAAVGAVLGCGEQGRTQVLAITTARPLREVRLWSRDPARARALAADLAGETEASLLPVDDAVAAVLGAEVVCTATPAQEPLFPASALGPRAHLNAVGSFTHDMVEFDPEILRDARVYVDDLAAAEAEAGELHRATRAGWSGRAAWTEIGRLFAGTAGGTRTTGRSVFKSVGLAIQDAAAAGAAVAAARRRGIGRRLVLE